MAYLQHLLYILWIFKDWPIVSTYSHRSDSGKPFPQASHLYSKMEHSTNHHSISTDSFLSIDFFFLLKLCWSFVEFSQSSICHHGWGKFSNLVFRLRVKFYSGIQVLITIPRQRKITDSPSKPHFFKNVFPSPKKEEGTETMGPLARSSL